MFIRTALLLSALAAVSSSALADYATVNLDDYVNFDIHQYTNGTNYPDGGQTMDFGGVPFALSTFSPAGTVPDPHTLGAVQLFEPSNLRDTHSIFVNITGMTRLYTLINTAFGQAGQTSATIEVFGAGGSFFSADLVQGVNVRDHFNDGFVNTLSDPTVFPTDFPGDIRLDRQQFDLPASFATDTITEIRFSGDSNTFNGEAFMAGATFATVPTPGAAALGLIAGAVMLRRRR